MADIVPYRHVEVVKVEECESCERRRSRKKNAALARARTMRRWKAISPSLTFNLVVAFEVMTRGFFGLIESHPESPPGFLTIFFVITSFFVSIGFALYGLENASCRWGKVD